MNETHSTKLAVDVGMLHMTTAAADNTAVRFTENATEVSNMNASDSDNFESYLLYNITAYMSEYHWLLLIFGVPGNLASIYTILSMVTVSSSKAHVAILAITDTLSIVSKFFYQQISLHAVKLTIPGCIITMFLQQFCTSYANWIVVAMTTERFLAVWFPLQVGRMYTRRKALIVLAGLAGMTTAIYFFFFWSWTEEYEEGYGYKCTLKEEYLVFMSTFVWVEGMYCAVIPCLLILIGNILIITNIKRARRAQRHLTNSFDQGGRKARDQRQITMMLIVVSIVFLLLNVPSAIFYFVKAHWDREQPYDNVKYLFTARFIHMLADSNHAINFYLYFLSMSSFRRRFLDAVRCRSYMKRRAGGNSMSRTSQTYLHSGHHSCDPNRLDNSFIYSAYKRSSSSTLEQAQPLKTINSNNNRSNHHHQNVNFINGMDSACSDV